MKATILFAAALALALAASHGFAPAQSNAPGAAPAPRAVMPPPPAPRGLDAYTAQIRSPRPGVGDLAGHPNQTIPAKSYCYLDEGDCTAWLTACMSPQSGNFACAAGPGDNGVLVCVCQRY